jgi:hypothetical protein
LRVGGLAYDTLSEAAITDIMVRGYPCTSAENVSIVRAT